MAGAKFIDSNGIDPSGIEATKPRRRPITSHYRGGDRLPSRASKTRDKSKRIRIGAKKHSEKQQGPITKPRFTHESVSPKNGRAYGLEEVSGDSLQNLELRQPEPHVQARQNLHTAVPNKKMRIFEELAENDENEEPLANRPLRFREKLNRKRDIIIEEEADKEEEARDLGNLL